MSFFDPPLLMPPRELWRAYFGKPDGILVVARCRLLGHRWERCDDACCEGNVEWCARCASLRRAETRPEDHPSFGVVSTEPIPLEDLERAAEFVREQGWVNAERPTEGKAP